jgi:hypothetical protein
MIWIQVRDLRAEHARLAAAGVPVIREPVTEPWDLTEMWIQDPDGIQIVLVEVPAAHSLAPRPATGPTAAAKKPARRGRHLSRQAATQRVISGTKQSDKPCVTR